MLVYPYPRVYPTRLVPAGMGRVRVDVLRIGSGIGVRSPRVRVYPFLPVKNTIFHDVGAISNVFFYFFLTRPVLANDTRHIVFRKLYKYYKFIGQKSSMY